MLVLGRDAKIGEDQRDDEHIVHRQGQFSDVTGDEQQRFLFAHVWLHEGEGKNQRQAKPNHGPGERFLEPDDVSAAMKHPQVQRQKKQNNNNEACPVKGRDFNLAEHDPALRLPWLAGWRWL